MSGSFILHVLLYESTTLIQIWFINHMDEVILLMRANSINELGVSCLCSFDYCSTNCFYTCIA